MIHRKQTNICKSLNLNRNFMNAIPVPFHSLCVFVLWCKSWVCVIVCVCVVLSCLHLLDLCALLVVPLCTKAIISNTRNNWCNGIIFWRQTYSKRMNSGYSLHTFDSHQHTRLWVYFRWHIDPVLYMPTTFQYKIQIRNFLWYDNKQHLNISSYFSWQPLLQPCQCIRIGAKMHTLQYIYTVKPELQRTTPFFLQYPSYAQWCRFRRYNNIAFRIQINLNILKCIHIFHVTNGVNVGNGAQRLDSHQMNYFHLGALLSPMSNQYGNDFADILDEHGFPSIFEPMHINVCRFHRYLHWIQDGGLICHLLPFFHYFFFHIYVLISTDIGQYVFQW